MKRGTSNRVIPSTSVLPLLLLAFCVVRLPQACAQPSDAQVIKDLTGKKTISVKLTSRGQKQVESLRYVWVRNAECTVKADVPEYPGVKLLVTGTAVYDITRGKYFFRHFRVASNSYVGIPNPTAPEIKAFLEKSGTAKLVGDYLYNNIVSSVEYKLSPTPDWEWPTPISVCFNISGKYDVLSAVSKSVETVEQVFRVRLYADKAKGPWTSMMSSATKKQVVSTREVSPDEYNKLKAEESLRMKDEKARAEGALAKLPQVEIPDFKSDEEIIRHTHKVLREATPEELESYLMRVIAPGYFLEGSTVMLNQRGADMVNDIVKRAHRGKLTYREAYLPNPPVAHKQRNMVQFYPRVSKMMTRISVGQYGTSWKLNEVSISIPSTPAEVDHVRSLGDPDVTPAPGATAAPSVTWKPHNLTAVNAEISFPDKSPQEKVQGKQYQYLLGHGTGTYMVTAWDLGQEVSGDKALQVVDKMATSFAGNLKYAISAPKEYVYEGRTGRGYTLTSGSKVIRYKSVVIGKFLYQLVLSSDTKTLSEALENGFFGSFRVH